MPRVSIEYLNERRNAARKGKTIFHLDTNAIDLRDQWHSLDACEQILSELDFAIDDFRRKRAAIVADSEMLLRGESYEDLCF